MIAIDYKNINNNIGWIVNAILQFDIINGFEKKFIKSLLLDEKERYLFYQRKICL